MRGRGKHMGWKPKRIVPPLLSTHKKLRKSERPREGSKLSISWGAMFLLQIVGGVVRFVSI